MTAWALYHGVASARRSPYPHSAHDRQKDPVERVLVRHIKLGGGDGDLGVEGIRAGHRVQRMGCYGVAAASRTEGESIRVKPGADAPRLVGETR